MSAFFLVLLAVCCTVVTLCVDGRHDNSAEDVLKVLDQVNKRMQNMENEMKEQKIQFKDQLERYAELLNQNIEQKMLINELKNENEQLKKMQIALEERIDILQVNSMYQNDAKTGVVAFLAKRAAFTGSDTEYSVIPFDLVELNIGNAYDPITGTFTPPVHGLYSISFEALCDSSCGDGSNICIQLHVNAVLQSVSCSEWVTTTGTALTLQLSAGDAVGLYMDPGQSCLSLHPFYNNNKFSGHLIYQII